jgi:ribonucleoside-diphosphate reductase alpha chain
MNYLDEKQIIHRGKKFCPELEWKDVRSHIKAHGMRNSNTMAIAPTATISYIQGCSPSVEPDFSTLFVYENKSGNLLITNEWFVKECKALEIWDQKLIDMLKAVDGDVMRLNGELPTELKARFKTAFDQDQFKLIDNAAAKQKWIDMGQSLNLFNKSSSLKYLNDLYMHARIRGLKSTYYLRNKSASKIEKATAMGDANNSNTDNTDSSESSAQACSIEAMENGGTCESCQ